MGAIGLKYTEGFTRLWPTIGTIAAMVLSIALLGIAMRDIPVGTAYAVWTGIGAVGTVIFGIVLFGDSAAPSAPDLCRDDPHRNRRLETGLGVI